MSPWKKLLLSWLLIAPVAASAQIDLTTLDAGMPGARAQVLVLGTVHLREQKPPFEASALQGLLDRLVAFRPEIITIEALNGEECDLAARHPAKYGADYCASTEIARKATGLEVPAAMAELDKTLRGLSGPQAGPAAPTPAQRRHLAALFLASNERASAYVQWLQLPAGERHAGDGLDDALVEMLRKLAEVRNENYQIAAALAARLGLQRVHAIDNHTGDNLVVAPEEEDAFGRDLKAAWGANRAPLDAWDQRAEPLKRAPDLLPLYRAINAPAHARLLAEVNVKGPMQSASPYPRVWVGGWEIRNLRMVANIRETFRERPAARVLSIVGASHKPWFDAWLGQLQGVEIVDVEKVLK